MSEDLEPIEKVEPPCQIYYLQSSSGKVYRCYLKSEADKVIAEKDAEIAELKGDNERLRGESCKLTDGCLRLKQCRKEKANIADELRHQKYKRCLAMAKWCDEVMMSCELRGYAVHRIWANRHQWAMRWKYRWLALAEEPTWAKFLQLIHKEAK